MRDPNCKLPYACACKTCVEENMWGWIGIAGLIFLGVSVAMMFSPWFP